MNDGFDFQQVLDFFSQMQGSLGDFEFTPEMLEQFGVILPALGMYSEFQKADYQQDALDFMREEMGLKGEEIALAREQLAFESGPAWQWYTEVFFPESQKQQQLEWDTQRYLMEGQRGIADQESNQARERTLQSQEATRQSEMATEMARYQMMAELKSAAPEAMARARRRAENQRYGYV